MDTIKDSLNKIRTRVSQVNPELGTEINDMVNYMDENPKIETFAKPRATVTQINDNGTIHSFAVEIKSNQDGPIPDTQLMSKILQAIESHNGVEGDVSQMSTGVTPSFEVVSFKYERREDKKKQ